MSAAPSIWSGVTICFGPVANLSAWLSSFSYVDLSDRIDDPAFVNSVVESVWDVLGWYRMVEVPLRILAPGTTAYAVIESKSHENAGFRFFPGATLKSSWFVDFGILDVFLLWWSRRRGVSVFAACVDLSFSVVVVATCFAGVALMSGIVGSSGVAGTDEM